MNVGVIGLGAVGLPTARYISQYHTVYGLDLSIDKVKVANDYFEATEEWSKLPRVDVYTICVNTWWRGNKPDMSAIEDVCRHMKERNDAELVSIESTVSLGTCRKIRKEIFDEKITISSFPHRLYPRMEKEYGVRQIRVLGSLPENGVAEGFYQSIDIPFIKVSPLELAELSKLTENSYRFIEIAFAEELALLCERHGLDFDTLRRACNTLKRKEEDWQVQIMEARDGIGGTCLPKDIMFLCESANPKELILGAALTDEVYKKHKRIV